MSYTSMILSTGIFSLFISSSHPLSLIIYVIMQTIFLAWYLTQLMNNTWLSLVMFLIFLGGLLIIFIYLSSVVPNETMKIKMNMFFLSMMTLMILNPVIIMSLNHFLKKMSLFASTQLSNMIPLILIYMLGGLTVAMYTTSFMKTPSKQEMM